MLPSLFGKTAGLGKILGGASKTISFVNSIVPIYYQVKPVINTTKNLANMYKNSKKNEFIDNTKSKNNAQLIRKSNNLKKENTNKVKTNSNTNRSLTFFV